MHTAYVLLSLVGAELDCALDYPQDDDFTMCVDEGEMMKQDTCPRCGSVQKDGWQSYQSGKCADSWHRGRHAPPPKGATPTQQQCSPEHPCDFCESTREPAVPPVPARVCGHKEPLLNSDCITCSEEIPSERPTVPAEPRSAEQFAKEIYAVLNLGGNVRSPNTTVSVLAAQFEAYAQPIREQLAAAERENKRLKLKTWTQYKAEKVNELEAALLSAQKEIADSDATNLGIILSMQSEIDDTVEQLEAAQKEVEMLKTKTAKLIEGLPNYSASSSMYQRVEALKALIK